MVHIPSLLSGAALVSAVVASPFGNAPAPVVDVVQRAAPEQPLQFMGISYAGDGCPEGSITTGKVDFEKWEFQVFYKKLTASIQPKAPKVKVKCQIKLDFQTTASKQLVVLGGDYRGHINLEAGVYAKELNQYKFKNNPGISNMQWEFKGPKVADTTFTNVLNVTAKSGCNNDGGKYQLIINNYLTLTSDPEMGGAGNISVSELDAEVMQSIKLSTEECSK